LHPGLDDLSGREPDMTPTKLLIGQILIVFAIVILGVWPSGS
jgi:hypothetical protein